MSKFESPQQFDLTKIIDGIEIKYLNLMEISQGGPEIGNISINGKILTDHRFGGPFLHDNQYIFIPLYTKSFLSSGFKLAKIMIETLSIELIGKTKNLIYLYKIENSKVFYYQDLEKSELLFYEY